MEMAARKKQSEIADNAVIKIQTIKFDQPPFRKLGDIEIDLAPRVTLIAGRNGVGKSTILALIAGGSGITRGGAKFHSYLGALPNVATEDILKLSFERDFVKEEAQKANVLITYSYGAHTFQKKCNVSGSEERLRIVPRNEPKGEFTVDGVTIPADGKVPIPTIYLGMTRVLPVGEAEPESLVSDEKTPMEAEDYDLYHDFTDRIISTGAEASGVVTSQYVRGTKKHSVYPEYGGYNSTNVSLGQDSLSSIATALASFKKLKRVMGSDYRGGLLIIDEVDAGFHPHAQITLLDELMSKARALQIQIIATTHSLTMLEHAHQEIYSNRKRGTPLDQIVYLQGNLPIQLLDATNFEAIYADMHLKTLKAIKTPSIKVFLEDDEAARFLTAILTRTRRAKLKASTGYLLEVIGARVGCSNLVGLLKADPYFHSVIFVIDADADSVKSGGALNVLRLPKDPAHKAKQLKHLEGAIGWDDTDAIALLQRAVEEMESRYAVFKDRRVRTLADFNAGAGPSERLPWWVIVLDEYADLTSDTQSKKDIEQELRRLAQKARASGIHLIIATQKPSGDVISTNLRSNLPAQLALRVKSGIESRVIMDETGAEALNGKGDAYLKSEGRIIRVQCARVTPLDLV
jgi:predicted ATPase